MSICKENKLYSLTDQPYRGLFILVIFTDNYIIFRRKHPDKGYVFYTSISRSIFAADSGVMSL